MSKAHVERIARDLDRWAHDEAFMTIVGACRDLLREVGTLQTLLLQANHTLCLHGKIDAETPLHNRIKEAVEG